MDPDGIVTLTCATRTEARAARRAGRRAVVVGMMGRRGLPDGPLVSFGLAGALHDGLARGTVLDATRVVDRDGNTLWEGGPLGVGGARTGTILAAECVVDDPEERRALRERTGADAVDLESGVLARSGRLVGCLRVVSDTPSRTLGPLAHAVGPDGRLAWGRLARAMGRPRETGRALADIRHALRRLEDVTA